MIIKKTEFLISNTELAKCPKPVYHEYAFIGRSNVGKSALINMLTGRKKLAKVSSTPGKTQLINHFIVNDNWYLVDLPGYGYAKVSKEKRKTFSKLIEKYLLNRENLVCLFALIDCRIKPQANDLDFLRWLGKNEIPFAIIFTKSDKLTKNQLEINISHYKNELLRTWEEVPKSFISSAVSNLGQEDILNYINELNQTVVISS